MLKGGVEGWGRIEEGEQKRGGWEGLSGCRAGMEGQGRGGGWAWIEEVGQTSGCRRGRGGG